MSTSTALSGAAVAQSTIAMQQAHSAKVTACTKFVKGYVHEGASTAEMREYAGCVSVLYPRPATADESIAIKAAIVFMFACFVFGAFRGFGSYGGPPSLGDRVMGAIKWTLYGGCGLLGLGLLLAGVVYLLS